MSYRIRNISIALVLAAIAIVLVVLYVTNYRQEVRQEEAMVTVYVAAKQIEAGTPGAKIVDKGLLESQEVVQRTAVPGAVTDPAAIEKLVAAETIYEGEQLTTSRFRSVEEQGIRSEIVGVDRAFQLAGDRHQLLAGTLENGDRIDVVASIRYSEKEVTGGETAGGGERIERVASRVVLRNLLVLQAAVLDDDGSAIREDDQSLNVILAVTDDESQKLFWVVKNADWSLQLRPANGAKDSDESVETVESVLGDGLKPVGLDQLVTGFTEGGR
jgi:Flp pilus assembly protein CpaB